MFIKYSKNEYGTNVSNHICDTCGVEYSVCPAVSINSVLSKNCLSVECASYDPELDIDMCFGDLIDFKDTKIIGIGSIRNRRKQKTNGNFSA